MPTFTLLLDVVISDMQNNEIQLSIYQEETIFVTENKNKNYYFCYYS